MTPEQKGKAKRHNEFIKNVGAFCVNASIGFFAGMLGMLYSPDPKAIYLVIDAGLMGALFAWLATMVPKFMRDED